MMGSGSGARTRMTTGEASLALRYGDVTPLFQPIEALQTGACRGFEALARLTHHGELVGPDQFLPGLDDDDRLCLFGAMLGAGIALMKREGMASADLYISINVEISLIVSEDFVDVLAYFLERHDFGGERIVLEILENEDVLDLARLRENLEAVRGLGLSIALDDMGSAYASLLKIKMLPIDILKLDRSFSKDLDRKPEDLMFVMSILSLARGLGKRLIVEGIETPEVYDALRVMGVELGQGYVIAKPMPADAVGPWLAARRIRDASRLPTCLLGAYASHLTVVESGRVLRSQPLPVSWTEAAGDFESCVLGQLFTARGWHDTAFGRAHKAFHAVLPLHATHAQEWIDGAEAFHAAMAHAIVTNPSDYGCTIAAVEATAPKRRTLKSCDCAPTSGSKRPKRAVAR